MNFFARPGIESPIMTTIQYIGDIISQSAISKNIYWALTHSSYLATQASAHASFLTAQAYAHASLLTAQACDHASLLTAQASLYSSALAAQTAAIGSQASAYITLTKPIIESYLLTLITYLVQTHATIVGIKNAIITTLTPYTSLFLDYVYNASLHAAIKTAVFLDRNPDAILIAFIACVTTLIGTSVFVTRQPLALSSGQASKNE